MIDAFYARVSTVGQSTQQQLDRLRAVAPGAVEYIDDAVSGRLDSRPAFDRLREEIEARRITTVYVCKIDRLGRSAKGILEFFDLAESNGCRVVVTDQGVDTLTPIGKVVRTILAALSELESDLIRERTQAAMDAFRVGTRTPKGKVGHPVVATPEKVARAVALRHENPKWTWSQLAQHVGLKRETVRRAVREATRTLPADPSTESFPDGRRNVQTPDPT